MWEQIVSFFGTVDVWQFIPAFFFLIAIIDPIGNMPFVIAQKEKGSKVSPIRVCLYSMVILMVFLLAGDLLLKIFDIRVEYFAIAGGFIIFLMAVEMLLDVVLFKPSEFESAGDLIPLAFPAFAGPGTFTALVSMTAEYTISNLLITIVLCIFVIYLVLIGIDWLQKHLSAVSLYIIRKFFGVIAMAISVQLMFGNLLKVFRPEVARAYQEQKKEKQSRKSAKDDVTSTEIPANTITYPVEEE
ncbi:MAG: MarC family protein [Paludibacteraceae bacterium]|nr:MarC family protein [Paludibacteraceae bacterium]